MGCSTIKENLENEIMKLQIQRIKIQMEKYKELEKLSKIEKHKIKPNFIPDYIDPKFAKERQIYIKNSKDKKSEKTNYTKVKKVNIFKRKNLGNIKLK